MLPLYRFRKEMASAIRYMIITVTLLGWSFVLCGQACCSGGVPISSNLGLSTGDARSWQFLLSYDLNRMKDLMDERTVLDDDTRTRTTHSILLEANYGLSRRITLTTMVSLVRQERAIRSSADPQELTATQGLGDGVLLVKYRLGSTGPGAKTNLSIGAGPKIPIGGTNSTNDQGLALPADMQPGTGAWDVMLWSYFSRSGIVLPNLTLSAFATYRATGTNKHYFGRQAYKFGNEFQVNLGFNYRVLVRTTPFDLLATFRYRHQSDDKVDGGIFPNSGGHWVFVVPTIAVNFTPNFAVRLSADIPVYRKLEGTQLTTNHKLTGALFYRIDPKPKQSSSAELIKPQ